MPKENWKIETFWSPYPILAYKLKSWKQVNEDLYITEFIVLLRVQNEQVHIVMADDMEVVMLA